MNYLGRLGNYAKEADRVEDNVEYHRVMELASKNLRSMADEWQVATAGMVSGDLSIDDWNKRLDVASSGHDWTGMGTSCKAVYRK